jgi:hypothetical protein
LNGGDEESKAHGAAVGPPRRGGLSARRLRLGLWLAVVTTVLFGDLSGRRVVAFAGLAALILLLRTTPADAIKLRRRTSNLLIIAVTILLMPWRWQLFWVPVVTVALLFLLRLARRSPWWAVVFAWNPAAVTAGGCAVAAVLVPVLGLTGLAISAGGSNRTAIAGVVVDALFFAKRRMQSRKG